MNECYEEMLLQIEKLKKTKLILKENVYFKRLVNELIEKIQTNLDILFVLGQDLSLFDMFLSFAHYAITKKFTSSLIKSL